MKLNANYQKILIALSVVPQEIKRVRHLRRKSSTGKTFTLGEIHGSDGEVTTIKMRIMQIGSHTRYEGYLQFNYQRKHALMFSSMSVFSDVLIGLLNESVTPVIKSNGRYLTPCEVQM